MYIFVCICVCVLTNIYTQILQLVKDINLILNYLKLKDYSSDISFQIKEMKSPALRGKQMSLSSRVHRTSSRTQSNPEKLKESSAGKK